MVSFVCALIADPDLVAKTVAGHLPAAMREARLAGATA